MREFKLINSKYYDVENIKNYGHSFNWLMNYVLKEEIGLLFSKRRAYEELLGLEMIAYTQQGCKMGVGKRFKIWAYGERLCDFLKRWGEADNKIFKHFKSKGFKYGEIIPMEFQLWIHELR